MAEDLTYEERLRKSGSQRKIARFIALIAVLSAAIFLPLYDHIYQLKLGPKQPIPFSHRVHVTKKQVSCVVCHTEAPFSDRAGVPPAQTCMLCHTRIIIHYPPIEDLRGHYFERRPILWNRISEIPDYAYFSHRVHVQKGVDCGKCHGDVACMDRVEAVHNFRMDFCMSCHREQNAPIGCYTCHR
jgi:hypothetical protein